MQALLYLTLISLLPVFFGTEDLQKVFDVHIHGAADSQKQVQELANAGVYKAAISTSWNLQNTYRNTQGVKLLYGLMFPCPNGKVPYSAQKCYADANDWPPISWVEEQIKEKKIDFFGEVLNQYYGISPSDSSLFPYYALAQKHHLPVGVHTGGAGPNHGSPNFKIELGNPLLLMEMLAAFPKLKVWVMHNGDQFLEETIAVMKANKGVYSDISVISNPAIVSPERFGITMRAMVDAGLEDRLMFGTDNGEIEKVIASVKAPCAL